MRCAHVKDPLRRNFLECGELSVYRSETKWRIVIVATFLFPMSSLPPAPTPSAPSTAARSSPSSLTPEFASLLKTLKVDGVRTDKGAAARAEVRAEMELDILLGYSDGEFDGEKFTPSFLLLGTYHVMNTQYVGIPDGLPRYLSMLRALSCTTDEEVLQYMRGKYIVRVENGVIGVFGACHKCGCRSDEKTCRKCYMKGKRECVECAVVEDVRRTVKTPHGSKCLSCYNGEIIDCGRCKKRVPRGHACLPPDNVQEDLPSGRGRPRKITARRFFPRGKAFGKNMIMCNLGCPPDTFMADRSWKRHVRRKHPATLGITEKLYKCKVPGCSYLGCNDLTQFKRHKLSHLKERQFVCKYCKKAYKQSEGLSSHYSRMHPEHVKKTHYRHDASEKVERNEDVLARIVLGI